MPMKSSLAWIGACWRFVTTGTVARLRRTQRASSMRDEDDHDRDESGPDRPAGRLLYSGFNPHAPRADYAVPFGEPALQGGDAEFELPEPGSRGSNRSGDVVGGGWERPMDRA